MKPECNELHIWHTRKILHRFFCKLISHFILSSTKNPSGKILLEGKRPIDRIRRTIVVAVYLQGEVLAVPVPVLAPPGETPNQSSSNSARALWSLYDETSDRLTTFHLSDGCKGVT